MHLHRIYVINLKRKDHQMVEELKYVIVMYLWSRIYVAMCLWSMYL